MTRITHRPAVTQWYYDSASKKRRSRPVSQYVRTKLRLEGKGLKRKASEAEALFRRAVA